MVATAVMLFSVLGTGLVQAAPASAPAATPTAPAALEPTTEGAAEAPAIDRLRLLRQWLAHPGRWGRHLVHSTVTIEDRNGNLLTFQFDHGTIAAIGDHSISIAETGGATVTVATSDATRVRKDKTPARLSDLAVGDEVFVASRVEGGTATARGILVPAARSASAAT
jgi:hypothetical protein